MPFTYRALTIVATCLALASVGLAPAVAEAGGVPAIPLNTEQETTGSNTGASGFFSYTISGTDFCYTLEARDLSAAALAAHVHVAPRNTAGPIVIPLTVGSGTSFIVTACTTAAAELLAAIAANPGGYYVNVHTPTFPGGEIRGQLK
jgi:hypothetical protein